MSGSSNNWILAGDNEVEALDRNNKVDLDGQDTTIKWNVPYFNDA
jgi:hypothetical protein